MTELEPVSTVPSEAEPRSLPTDDVAALAAKVNELQEQLKRLQAEKDELWQTLIRRQADFENFRKRLERERQHDADRAVMALAEELLPILDNFERALAAHTEQSYEDYRRGFELIYRQLEDLLARYGITRIPNPVGQPFDPYYHHALERVETGDYPEGTVIEVLQAGYRFRDRLLRPALVRVAAQPTSDSMS